MDKDGKENNPEGNRKKGTSVILSKAWVKSQIFRTLWNISRVVSIHILEILFQKAGAATEKTWYQDLESGIV